MKAAGRAAPDLETAVRALEQLLRAQLEAHQRLLSSMERKRLAIRTADIGQVTALCEQEEVLARRLRELERHRTDVTARVASFIGVPARAPSSITEIVAALPAEQAASLAAVAAGLRDAMDRVKRESSIVRAAAEALSRHMTGVVQTVHSALSRARIYGQKGQLALGAQIQSTLDLKS